MEDVKTGEIGEIVHRSPHPLSGYTSIRPRPRRPPSPAAGPTAAISPPSTTMVGSWNPSEWAPDARSGLARRTRRRDRRDRAKTLQCEIYHWSTKETPSDLGRKEEGRAIYHQYFTDFPSHRLPTIWQTRSTRRRRLRHWAVSYLRRRIALWTRHSVTSRLPQFQFLRGSRSVRGLRGGSQNADESIAGRGSRGKAMVCLWRGELAGGTQNSQLFGASANFNSVGGTDPHTRRPDR
jgi:hypothetical protein